MFNAFTLFASLVWGSLGSGIFIFGWKQKSTIPLAGGLLLVIISYFAETAVLMSLISVIILAGMYWFKRRGY